MGQIESRLDAIFGAAFNSGPAPEITVAAAEASLGLRFPPSYRQYLLRYGASLCSGFEIFGLPPVPDPGGQPQWSNTTESTLRLRPDGLPENSIQISHDGMDHGYFLQCSLSDTSFEGPVIEWGPTHGGGEIVAAGFLDFVEQQNRR
ncbi:SMI1/KNR4 family protein [Lignipirellula cremea]|uniref:SMI1 / KNR4 family protein n=1 Tax=Lignipirellula cremea TaxID=2528010 RepID=A0A518E4J8_9BACT|nr:SMI1 / KNR4 family protein [Lignipirellula cremea]